MLKKISVERLKLGMYIHELCGSWMEHPFWRTRFALTDPEDLRRIRETGITELWIDVTKGLDEAEGETKEQVDAKVERVLMETARHFEAPIQVSMVEELERAVTICAKAKEAVVSMFQEVRMGHAIGSGAAGDLVDEISFSVMRNPSAFISLARLKTADNYTYMHSVAVCALMASLARQLKLDQDQSREVAMAGLLHDMGKAFTPQEVLNKPGKLTDEEFAVMRRHPLDGHRVLAKDSTLSDIPIDVCLHHHEKIDGSGYPEHLTGERISLYAKMGAVCDVYDAITSNRPYKTGWDPAESIRKMTEWSKGHFDEQILYAFMKSIGIYPIGSLVRLESGRLAVVVEQTEKSLLAPKVKVFYSTQTQAYIKPELVDLSRSDAAERIVGREDAAKWGIKNLEQLWAP